LPERLIGAVRVSHLELKSAIVPNLDSDPSWQTKSFLLFFYTKSFVYNLLLYHFSVYWDVGSLFSYWFFLWKYQKEIVFLVFFSVFSSVSSWGRICILSALYWNIFHLIMKYHHIKLESFQPFHPVGHWNFYSWMNLVVIISITDYRYFKSDSIPLILFR
jgi:hypothetical protein